jgi:hypothetical protein
MTVFQYLVLAQNVAQDVAQEAMGQMDQSSGQALWMTWWLGTLDPLRIRVRAFWVLVLLILYAA